jgi:hypothetical protein
MVLNPLRANGSSVLWYNSLSTCGMPLASPSPSSGSCWGHFQHPRGSLPLRWIFWDHASPHLLHRNQMRSGSSMVMPTFNALGLLMMPPLSREERMRVQERVCIEYTSSWSRFIPIELIEGVKSRPLQGPLSFAPHGWRLRGIRQQQVGSTISACRS